MLHYTVIIPLGFHREVWPQCLASWLEQKNVSPEHYELILAAPCGFSREELDSIRCQLRSWDTVFLSRESHDMHLITEAARRAQGKYLVFTESHCIAAEDFLHCCEKEWQLQPDWEGFSGRSVPMTHDVLSEVEAEMYATHIQSQVQEHGWLKVLDQCLILRRAAYEKVGGIQPEYGHFAEWVLAHQLYQAGLKLGYAARVKIQHYYCGDLLELRQFAEDFGRGHMHYQIEHGSLGPAGQQIDPPLSWGNRYASSRRHAWLMLSMYRKLGRSQNQGLNSGQIKRRQQWRKRLLYGAKTELRSMRTSVMQLEEKTRLAMLQGDKKSVARYYKAMNDQATKMGELEYLIKNPLALPRSVDLPKRSGRWTAADPGAALQVGFEPISHYEGLTHCYTAPEAMIWLPLGAGQYLIRLRWVDLPALRKREGLRFLANGKLLSKRAVILQPGWAEFSVSLNGTTGLWLGIAAPEHYDTDVDHALGLPLRSLSWRRRSTKDSLPLQAPAAAPFYFLHVPKTMGTAVRYAMENGYAMGEIFSPLSDIYNGNDLLNHKLEKNSQIQFYRGHFGQLLMRHLADSPPRVLTVLRDPTERLLSFYDYSYGLQRIASEMTLEEWLKQEVGFNVCMISHFVDWCEKESIKGISAAAKKGRECLKEALRNLQKCTVVGLQEEAEVTFLMLCHQVGSWPQDGRNKVNVSNRRSHRAALSSEASELIHQIIEADNALYNEGRKLFEQHKLQLFHELGIDLNSPDAVYLAREELRRRVRLKYETPLLCKKKWLVTDPYLGENLQQLEQHDGKWLRWTGPSNITAFTYPLATKEECHFQIMLHSATPLAHAEAATLLVNDHEVPLSLCLDSRGNPKYLRGRLTSQVLKASKNVWHEFILTAPAAALKGEVVRKIGLCLLGWQFELARKNLTLLERSNDDPLISIIIPVKNATKLLLATLESILNHAETCNVECLIQDAASTDGIADVVAKYGGRVKLVSEPDSCIYDGINRALERSKGKWILILGAGDRLRSGVLTGLRSSFETHDKPTLIYGDVWMEDQQRRYGGSYDVARMARNNICQQGIFYHWEVFAQMGGFDLNYPVLSDYAYNLRCFASPYIMKVYCDTIIADYLGNGMSATQSDPHFQADKAALVERYLKL